MEYLSRFFKLDVFNKLVFQLCFLLQQVSYLSQNIFTITIFLLNTVKKRLCRRLMSF